MSSSHVVSVKKVCVFIAVQCSEGYRQCCRMQALAELVRSGTDDVRICALETVGNLSFQVENRDIFLADAELLEWISRLAQDQVRFVRPPAVSHCAVFLSHFTLRDVQRLPSLKTDHLDCTDVIPNEDDGM